jgi:hypothetical protein
MAPDISAAHAPADNVATAIMDIDSLLRRIHAAGGTGSTGLAAEQLIDSRSRPATSSMAIAQSPANAGPRHRCMRPTDHGGVASSTHWSGQLRQHKVTAGV